MIRRNFFRALLVAAGAAPTLDPDRLLWVPGKKLISIPPPPIVSTILNPDFLTREARAILQRTLVFAKKLTREYDAEFRGAKVCGDTIQVRRPPRFRA